MAACHVVKTVLVKLFVDFAGADRILHAEAWCGKGLFGYDWAFQNIEHAERSVGGGIAICKRCLSAARKAGH